MKKTITSTLVISTYNDHKALENTLLSVLQQSVLPSEVIIADDGSSEETKELINKYKKIFPVLLAHKWHEDLGFRKTIILNEAISSATSEYIIQVDGDIIIHKNFIKNHISLAEANSFIEGSRVWLNEDVTMASQEKKKINFNWYAKGIKNRFNAMYIPFLTPFFTKPTQEITNAINTRGCNMSFWRSNFIAVNGYNEDMVGWGKEDSELSVRFVNSGMVKRKIKFSGIQYHQYHPINSREGLNKNDEILKITVDLKKTSCENGLSNHL